MDFGFRAVIAPSYADIFFNNCFKNGLLPVVLDAGVVDLLFHEVLAEPGYRLTIDLPQQVVVHARRARVTRSASIAFRKHCLLNGLDEIGLTLAARRRDPGVRGETPRRAALAVRLVPPTASHF